MTYIVKVNGQSMSPFLLHGKEYEFIDNLSDIKINDVVMYKNAGKNYVKFIKAIPNDIIIFEEIRNKKYNIVVNENVVLNSENKKYELSELKVNFLKGYLTKENRMMDNLYFCLGNDINGSEDSTRFGMVTIENIICKMVK